MRFRSCLFRMIHSTSPHLKRGGLQGSIREKNVCFLFIFFFESITRTLRAWIRVVVLIKSLAIIL